MVKRNPWLAVLATFGTPGLGHVYNGFPRQGIAIFLVSLLLYPILSMRTLANSFPASVVFLGILVILIVGLFVHSFRQARHVGSIHLQPYHRWYVYLGILVINALIISPILRTLVFPPAMRAFKIPSGTMLPAIRIGDRIIADMRAYEATAPSRGDIVIFKFPKDESTLFLKRVAALPGETIEVRGKELFVDGARLADPWGTYGPDDDARREDYGPTEMGADEFFLLGDNRDNSFDHRFWGPVKASKILGRARYLYWADDKSRIGTGL